MANGNQLPSGFQLDQPAPNPGGLPAGFELDAQSSAQQPIQTPKKSILETAASVPLEAMAAVNRGAANIADFFTVDQVNAWRQVFGREPDVQSITDLLSSATKGEFMEPGTARDIVRGAGEVIPAAVAGGGLLRGVAAAVPKTIGAKTVGQGVVQQLGSNTLGADIGYGAASGAGQELGEEFGGPTGRMIGAVAAPIAAGVGAQGIRS